jgi:hypothetical protein
MSLGDWICANTTIRGGPFSFGHYPFQKAIADDMHPDLAVIKPSQVGLSEVQIRKILGMLMRQTMVAIFTLPNEKMFKRMSQTRIQPLIAQNKVFTPETSQQITRSMGLMQFGKSFLHITAATEGDATSTAADAVFNDEVDLTNQKMLALFNSRLQNSLFKIRQRFSTPSFNGYGIDLDMQNSDTHEYFIRCTACNLQQVPEVSRKYMELPGLPDNIENIDEIDLKVVEALDLNNAYVCCERCRAPLDLGSAELREWVPKFPSRTHARGYKVRPFSTSRIDPAYIITQLLDYKKRDNLRGWYNTVVGEPFTGADARLTVHAIESCMTTQASVPDVGDAPVVLGCDVGQICHLTLGKGTTVETIRPFLFETVPANQLVERIADLRKIYNIVAGAVDRHPYTPTADEIMSQSKGIIVPVEYRGTKEIKLVKNEFDNLTHAQADRTMLLDEVVRRIKLKTLEMAGYGIHRQGIIDHLRDMVRKEEPEEPAEWIKLTGIDHWFHSLGFLLTAVKIQNLIYAGVEQEERVMCGVVPIPMPKGSTTTNLYGQVVRPSKEGVRSLL